MRRSFFRVPGTAVFFVPLLFGLIGFAAVDGEAFLDALFKSVGLYTMEYQETPPNVWIELGRWTAPMATASGILLIAVSLRDRFRNYIRYCRGDSIAVYGPDQEKKPLLAKLGWRGIDGKARFVRAQRYILLNSEAENFDFYTNHQQELRQSTVYLKCSSLPAQSVSAPGLSLFCPEETAARLFWKQRRLYDVSARRGHRLKLVFLGFDKLGEELLTCGLQINLFSPDQRIEYHIFGDGSAFSAVHTELHFISDPIFFHPEPWYTALPLVEEAQMVVVLEQKDQLSLLKDLLLAVRRENIDVFGTGSAGVKLLAGQERLAVFDWRREAQALEHILGDELLELAQRINLRYAHLNCNVPENSGTMREQWQLLDAFTRYSNIGAADYHEVWLGMLDVMGISENPERLPPEAMELLAELEHIRWCRYHFLNNWRYGQPENGAGKDSQRKLHADLLPYRELSEAEKEKDRASIRLFLSIR